MSKINTICLRCGKVQVRTDIMENISGKYVQIKNKRNCEQCNIKTNHIATKSVQELRKKLEEHLDNSLDNYVFKLIKR